MIGRRTILKKLEAVIFDFDGTIVDTEKVYFENMRDLTSEMLGKTLDKMDYIENVSGTNEETSRRYYNKRFGMSDDDYDKFEEEITRRIIKNYHNAPVLPGIAEVMEYLHEIGVKMAVASNGKEEHIRTGLQKKGFEKYIGAIATREEVENPKTLLPVEIQDNLIDAIYACHNGVLRMIPVYPSVVETSSNLAIIDIEGGKASIKILARSSREDMKEYLSTQIESCFNMAGMKTEFSASYNGWDPNPDSEILDLLKKIYKEQNGEEAIVQVDHAGLECSIILGKYPGMDVVSLGPTIRSPHTTTERFEISSAEPFWNLLVQTLEEIPSK